jgi:uncharacterized lipoprotein YehR (DUF1307 family)
MRNIAIVAAVLALSLAACSREPRVVSETSGTATTGGSITYKYEGDHIKDANEKAAAYCGKMGKQAQLRTTSRSDDDTLATFDCR